MFKDINIINRLSENIIKKLRQMLVIQKHNATGQLSQSLEYEIDIQTLQTLIKFLGNFYGKFINERRKAGGKRVPADALEAWIKVKGFFLAPNQTARNLAFAIQTSIHQKGIPAKPYLHWSEGNTLKRTGWIDDTLQKMEPDIKRDVMEAVTETIEIELENYSKKYGSKKVL